MANTIFKKKKKVTDDECINVDFLVTVVLWSLNLKNIGQSSFVLEYGSKSFPK